MRGAIDQRMSASNYRCARALVRRTHFPAKSRRMIFPEIRLAVKFKIFYQGFGNMQSEETMSTLRRIAISVSLLGLAMTIPVADALAQPILGGAIVGGAIGGRRGAAIGAATGAAVRAHRAYWHGHRGHWHGPNFYYWHRGNCWVRTSSGRSHVVSSRYCR
jgi:hypothetical protein